MAEILDLDFELFPGKTFSNLLKDIHVNSKTRHSEISVFIRELQPHIKTAGDAQMIVPLVAQYLKLSIDNDDQLIKLAAIVQRIIATNTRASNTGVGGDMSAILTDEEKQQLIEDLEEALESPSNTEKEMAKIDEKVKDAGKKMNKEIEKLIPKYDYSSKEDDE